MIDASELRRRIRAARELAEPTKEEIAQRSPRGDVQRGLSVEELAARLNRESEQLGKDTLSLMERGKREILPRDRRAIARACDLPTAFFSADLWLLKDLAEAMDEMPDHVLDAMYPREMIQRAFRLLAQEGAGQAGSEARLAELESAVKRIADDLERDRHQRDQDDPQDPQDEGEQSTRRAS